MMSTCDRCEQPLTEIDHYGDLLTGCLECNVWRGKQLVIKLPEEDLVSLKRLRAQRKEDEVSDGEPTSTEGEGH